MPFSMWRALAVQANKLDFQEVDDNQQVHSPVGGKKKKIIIIYLPLTEM
jgi:hypothetical protein